MTNDEILKTEQNKIDLLINDDNDYLSENAYAEALGELTDEQKKEVSRLEFSAKTKRVLAQRVGYRCSNPDCKTKSTVGPGDTPNSVVLLGEAAHIIGAIQDGKDRLSPRADSTKKIKDIIGLDNGIWLCRNCHKLVDSKTSTYTIQKLKDWKKQAEERQAKLLEEQPSTFVEEYIFPSIDVQKGVNSDNFKEQDWCLIAYLYCSKNDSGLSCKFDESFGDDYSSWLSNNAIDSKTAYIDFTEGWDTINYKLRCITDRLKGLVIHNSEGLDYGKEFDKFITSLEKDDENAISKIIKKLSKVD